MTTNNYKMADILLTQNGQIVNGLRRRTKVQRKIRFGFMSLSMSIMGLVTLIGITSLSSMNNKLTKGYDIDRLESLRLELVTEGEVNDMLILQARSIENIRDRAVSRGMHMPGSSSISYLNLDTEIALK